MDQKNIVGVGNIYASESLFLARINPSRLSRDLSLKDCENLVKSINEHTSTGQCVYRTGKPISTVGIP